MECLLQNFFFGDEQEVEILDLVDILERVIFYLILEDYMVVNYGIVGSSIFCLLVLKVVLINLLLLNNLPCPYYFPLCH